MIFDPAFHVIVKHNLVLAIMPPHIRGVPILFLIYPRVPALSRLHAGANVYRPHAWASVFGFAYAVTG